MFVDSVRQPFWWIKKHHKIRIQLVFLAPQDALDLAITGVVFSLSCTGRLYPSEIVRYRLEQLVCHHNLHNRLLSVAAHRSVMCLAVTRPWC